MDIWSEIKFYGSTCVSPYKLNLRQYTSQNQNFEYSYPLSLARVGLGEGDIVPVLSGH